MKTYLITGGAGFIGSNFIHMLRCNSENIRIVNFDLLTYAGNLESLTDIAEDEKYRFVKGDIADRALVLEVLKKENPNTIINFAAESHVDRSIDGPDPFVKTNVLGTFELLEAVRKWWIELLPKNKSCLKFLHISTDEVYGSLGETGLFSESNPYRPNSPYSASKAAADHFVRAYFHTFGIPAITTNCSNNYGPFQFPEKLIPLIIFNALNGKSLPVYGDGLQVRDWLFVEDHCRAIMRVIEAGKIGETYNIGGHNEIQNITIVRHICSLLDSMKPREDGRLYSEQIAFVKDRPGHDRRYAIDSAKITDELGWIPKESFETGIEKTIQWYLNNQYWCERVLSGQYRQ